MTVKIEDTEIRDQAHLMDAEGTSDADTKPLEADIVKLLAEKGYNAIDIDISFDTMQNIWRWCCYITNIFGTNEWKEEIVNAINGEGKEKVLIKKAYGTPLWVEKLRELSENYEPKKENYGWHNSSGFDDEPTGWAIEGGEQAYNEALKKYEIAKAAEQKEAVNHPSHYGGKDNPYEVVKIIDAWDLGFDLGNAIKYIIRAGKKDKSKEIEDLKKAAFYLDRKIRKLKTTQKATQPIEGEIEAAYLLTQVQEGLKMEGLLKTSIYHIYKTLFCTGELNETYTPDAKRLEIDLHNLSLALQSVNAHIYKLEIEAEKK